MAAEMKRMVDKLHRETSRKQTKEGSSLKVPWELDRLLERAKGVVPVISLQTSQVTLVERVVACRQRLSAAIPAPLLNHM